MGKKAWEGRFSGSTHQKVEAFTESISFDRRLWRQDIAGSIAHAQMLAEVNLIKPAEAKRIVAGLNAIAREIECGEFQFKTELEDIHMHIESALIERLGDLGRKLHTARSRNDQVATDLKLWLRDAVDRLDGLLSDLQREFLGFAQRESDVVIPGYTHLQRAQPMMAAHYALAYVEKFQRDRERLADNRKRINILPLGGAALAGTALGIDRQSVQKKLGFDSIAANSVDISSDRDFALEFVFDLAMVAVHLSGWAEEWILWNTTEFGFLALPDTYCTGSSIMPQKKNPDVLEIIRAKTARVAGALQTLFMLLKGLPLAYNRDLQEDKPPLFDAYDTVSASLEIAALIVSGARLNRANISNRIEDGFLDATSVMEYLIQKNVPMRRAHEVVGQLVKLCEQRNCRLADLNDDELRQVHPAIDPDVRQVLGVQNAVRAFQSAGSTAPALVAAQVRHWKKKLRSRHNKG